MHITAQVMGLKNIKVTGGWRLELDLFDVEQGTIQALVPLVSEQAVIKLTIGEDK